MFIFYYIFIFTITILISFVLKAVPGNEECNRIKHFRARTNCNCSVSSKEFKRGRFYMNIQFFKVTRDQNVLSSVRPRHRKLVFFVGLRFGLELEGEKKKKLLFSNMIKKKKPKKQSLEPGVWI